MNNYKAFLANKLPIDILNCKTSYEAQQRAATLWNLKPSQRSKITVVLCEKDSEQVIHLPLD
jgi:hypothetical protein